MRIAGAYVGLGIDPITGAPDVDDEIAKIVDWLYPRYTTVRNTVPRGRTYTVALATEITRQQGLWADRLAPGEFFIPGVINLAWKYASGYLKRPIKPKPIIFTVEGHLSDMWRGPSASIGATMSAEGRAYWQPLGYDCAKLPFNNADGVQKLYDMFKAQVLPDGTRFPPGLKWAISGFSQGAMVVCDFMRKHVIPVMGAFHDRLKDFVWGFCFGNPDRGRGAQVGWNDNPPDEDTSGIMLDELFDAVALGIGDRWGETANVGDLFSDCKNDDAGKNKAAIAKIVTRNSWMGGDAAVVARVLAIFKDLPKGALGAIMAIISAIMFAAKNPNPHYGQVAEPGDIDSFRQRLPVVR